MTMINLFYFIGTTILLLITIKKIDMSQETLDQLTNKVNSVTTSLTNIKDDITRIKDSLPTSGGLTEAEVATLSAQLDAAVTAADTLDKENEV